MLLLENATVPNDILGYILGKISVIEENITENSLKSVFQIINRHAAKVVEEGYDDGIDADHISRVFIAILERGNIILDQYKLNQAIKLLHPVLQECLFEDRHCRDEVL